MNTSKKINLLGLTQRELEKFFIDIGEPKYRAVQTLKWIHKHGCLDFDQMSDLSEALRKKLHNIASLKPPLIHHQMKSKDGTIKYLIQIESGSIVEMVRIPSDNRQTLCISSQAGCALQCSFCATGAQGFEVNLSASEIIGQLWLASFHDEKLPPITNIVFMGMGEPLLNIKPVLNSVDLMLNTNAYCISKRKITLSTSGIAPEIDSLPHKTDVSLALSLHAPNNILRDELVPINKKYPLEMLMESCKKYLSYFGKRKSITIEYIMINDVNDSYDHAVQLSNLLKQLKCKINLIPFNSFEGNSYQQSSSESINVFKDYLIKNGFVTTVRITRGDEVDGACGQLSGQLLNAIKSKKSSNIELKNIT